MQSLIEKLIRDQLVIYCLLLWIYLETSSQCSQKPEHSPEPKNSPSRTSTCPFIEYIFNTVLLSTNRSPKLSPSLASSAEDSINWPFTICTTVGKKLISALHLFLIDFKSLTHQKIQVGTNNTRTFPVLGHMALWLRIAPTTMHASTEWRKRGTTQDPLINELQRTLIDTTAQLVAKIISVMAFSLSVSLSPLSLSNSLLSRGLESLPYTSMYRTCSSLLL